MSKRAPKTSFGLEVSASLAMRNLGQTDLANQLGKSVSYVNQTLTGKSPVNGDWVDLVANALDVSPERRAEMHRAAAKDAGFKIELDLTTKEGA